MLRRVETYKPFDRQLAFHQSNAKYRLFGGAAGPGKSRALLEEAWITAGQIDGCSILLLRRTFPELEESLLKQFRLHIPFREAGCRYNDSKHICTLPNKSTIKFGYCTHENDVFQYQGGEYVLILVDELTLFSYAQWAFLTSRNRCPVPTYSRGLRAGQPVKAKMAGASNPGNIGHAWVKALWISKSAPPEMERPEEYDPKDYDFIPALISDNPIYANDKDYLKALSMLPEHQRQAFLLGDWDIFIGQYFSNFQRARHVATRKTIDKLLKPWTRRWMSIDWGHSHNAAVYWHAIEGDLVITYRELVKNKLDPTALAEMIVSKTPRDEQTGKLLERPSEIFLASETFRPNSWGEHSIPELMGDVFTEYDWPRPTPADNERIGGAMLMYRQLEQNAWIIGEDCPLLIGNIAAMTRDPENPEDVLKVDGDDPYDSARYGLKSYLSPNKKPDTIVVQERIADLVASGRLPPDPGTQHLIWIHKFLAEHKKKAMPKTFFGRRRH